LLVIVLPSVVLWGFALAALSVFAWRIRRWQELDRRGHLFVVCGGLAAVALLAFAIGGLCHKPSSTLLLNDQLVPHLPDETTLIRLKADPEAFVGKTFILCGDMWVANYYNFNYVYAQSTHYSFRFWECGKTWGDRREYVSAYLRRDVGKRIADELVRSQEESGASVACRIKGTILPGDAIQWNSIEILDVQFLNAGGDDWEPWMLGTPDGPK
jgi:hypothetical protein